MPYLLEPMLPEDYAACRNGTVRLPTTTGFRISYNTSSNDCYYRVESVNMIGTSAFSNIS